MAGCSKHQTQSLLLHSLMETYYASNDKHQKNEGKQMYKQLKFPTKSTALIFTGSNFTITLICRYSNDQTKLCSHGNHPANISRNLKKGDCLSRHKFRKAAVFRHIRLAQFRTRCFKHHSRKKEHFKNNRWSCTGFLRV